MAVKCFPSRGSVNTNFLMGKKVTSRVVHGGIRNYGKSPLQIIRGAPFQSRAQFVAAPFAGLLQSPCQNCGRTGRTLGTAPAADHFPANPLRVAEGKARHYFLRASAAL